MQSSRALREKAAQLLAADTATLAQAADANLVFLIMAPFTPTEGLLIADVEPATFTGSTPLEVELGAQAEGLDPASGDAIITILPPAGGFRFETTNTANLPQTIYGYGLCNDDSTTLFASANLPVPVTLSEANQVIDLGSITLRLLANSLT